MSDDFVVMKIGHRLLVSAEDLYPPRVVWTEEDLARIATHQAAEREYHLRLATHIATTTDPTARAIGRLHRPKGSARHPVCASCTDSEWGDRAWPCVTAEQLGQLVGIIDPDDTIEETQ